MSAFGSKADMAFCGILLSRSLLGVKRTWLVAAHMSAFDPPSYDFAGAFQAAAAGGAQLMMVLSSPAFSKRREELAELAVKHRLPTMFTFKHYVDGGGLMSYGVEFPPVWRRTADYVARILKGAKPADLPIEQPTKFELVVNLKTAKALGVTIPNGILLAADDVIE
jgi:putative tryptophan/tyrosine transport system substrate-binding protein